MPSGQVGETHPKLGSHRGAQAQSGAGFGAHRNAGISTGQSASARMNQATTALTRTAIACGFNVHAS